MAAKNTLYQKMQALKNNPNTSNSGTKWTSKEVNDLLKEAKNKDSISDMALNHKRTVGSINMKLLSIAESFITNEGQDIKDVSKIVNISEHLILDHINLVKEKNGNKPKKIKIIEEEEEIKKEIILNEEQNKAIDMFKFKKNIFLTGFAGTGKSVTISKIVEYCKINDIKVGITSTTASSALIIGGKTMHSFLGIGLGKESASVLVDRLKEKNMFYIFKKLRELDVLVIDEISMLNDELFDKISEYLCLIRKNKKPFGGLQVILTGDFCQLEPVEGNYCFKSKEWDRLELSNIYLKKMIRQNNDKEFQKMLLELRYGNCSDETFEKLKALNKTEFGEIKPTKLYSINRDVDKINNKEYKLLIDAGAEKKQYDIEYNCKKKDKEKTEKWAKNIEIPETIELCIGAQVVVTVNIDQEKEIINGTRGIIVELKPKSILIKRINGKIIEIDYFKCVNTENSDLFVSYMPLKLAYAITIHRSQGMSLDAIEIDIGDKIFAAGQAYTALSRAKNLKSIKIKDVIKESFITKKSVIKFYKKLEEVSDNIEI